MLMIAAHISASRWRRSRPDVDRGCRGQRLVEAPLLVRLWLCMGLALLMLTGAVGVASATPIRTIPAGVTSAKAATDDADGQGLEPSVERCVPARDDRTRVVVPELGAIELELDDDDLRDDMAAIAAASAPVLDPSALGRIAARAAADTGRSQVVTALARGPPVA